MALVRLWARTVLGVIRTAPREHLDDLRWDSAYALRMMRRNPGFVATAVLSIALGIGANTAVFSVVDAVLLRTLPVPSPEALVFVEDTGTKTPKTDHNLTRRLFEHLRETNAVLQGLCYFSHGRPVSVTVDGASEVVEKQPVSGTFFETLGIRPLLGRALTREDDRVTGGARVAVLGERYWHRRFGRDPSVIGRALLLDGTTFTIVGVAPSGFSGVVAGERPALFVPWVPSDEDVEDPLLPIILARLQPEMSERRAAAELTGLLQQALTMEAGSELSAERRARLTYQRIVLSSASRGLTSGWRTERTEGIGLSDRAVMLMAVVALVLVIACGNVAGLLLARASARAPEVALRVVQGATRRRLIRQLLTESMLLALAGGVLGLLLAAWSLPLLEASLSGGHRWLHLDLRLNVHLIAFASVVSISSAILFGLFPALRATTGDLTPLTKRHPGKGGGGGPLRWGNVLVVTQVALAMTALVGAGLFLRTFQELGRVDTGLTRDPILLVSTDPRMAGYSPRRISVTYEELLTRFRQLPGVVSVSLGRQGLVSGSGTTGSVVIEGRTPRPGENDFVAADGPRVDGAALSQISPDYFKTLEIPIVRGRGLLPTDDVHAPRVAVVNETFARHYFGAADPVGRRFGGSVETSHQIEIVGVARDAKYHSLREPVPRAYYVPYLQHPSSWRETTFQIRTSGDASGMADLVRRTIAAVDPTLPVNVKMLADQIGASLHQERTTATLTSLFGMLALVLTVIGLYGVLSYAVARRTSEIGVRMALGATAMDVWCLVIGHGMRLVVLGSGLGILVGLVAAPLVASQLYGVTPTDPATLVTVGIILLSVALAACAIPARRATRVDPLRALRLE